MPMISYAKISSSSKFSNFIARTISLDSNINNSI